MRVSATQEVDALTKQLESTPFFSAVFSPTFAVADTLQPSSLFNEEEEDTSTTRRTLHHPSRDSDGAPARSRLSAAPVQQVLRPPLFDCVSSLFGVRRRGYTMESSSREGEGVLDNGAPSDGGARGLRCESCSASAPKRQSTPKSTSSTWRWRSDWAGRCKRCPCARRRRCEGARGKRTPKRRRRKPKWRRGDRRYGTGR